MEAIYVASRNVHKISEFKELLEPLSCEVVGLPVGIPVAVEDGETFLENARKKAIHYADFVDGYALADDSGIVVQALDGRPGVLSARYAGSHGNDHANNQKLLKELNDVPYMQRTAEFVCALVLHNRRTGKQVAVEKRVSGVVLREFRGREGFGYDPLFYVPWLNKTFAEMTADEKNRFSHRALAVQALISALEESRDADLRSE
jgi:XTP/dITP diphosphohydrolase